MWMFLSDATDDKGVGHTGSDSYMKEETVGTEGEHRARRGFPSTIVSLWLCSVRDGLWLY